MWGGGVCSHPVLMTRGARPKPRPSLLLHLVKLAAQLVKLFYDFRVGRRIQTLQTHAAMKVKAIAKKLKVIGILPKPDDEKFEALDRLAHQLILEMQQR